MVRYGEKDTEREVLTVVLTGKYEHNLDSKNRLFVPAKHREILGESFMITCGSDRCLSVYSMVSLTALTKYTVSGACRTSFSISCAFCLSITQTIISLSAPEYAPRASILVAVR